jgi:hypothetical protein
MATIQITSCAELQKIGNDLAFPLAANYEITPAPAKNYGNDFIDCRATKPNDPNNTGSIWDKDLVGSYGYGGTGFKPIVNFSKIFDGKNYYIKNLYINRTSEDNVGVFGSIGQSAEIKNIKLTNLSVTGRNYVGGLVGRTTTSSYYAKISNCILDVTGANNVITGTGSNYTGGIIGYAERSDISYSSFSGSVLGASYVGGIVGGQTVYSDGTTEYRILSCSSQGTVAGTSNYIGGLVGYSWKSGSGFLNAIMNSSSGSVITGANYVGGLAGKHDSDISSDSSYKCYATGNVTGTGDWVGGLAGKSTMIDYKTASSRCYTTGNVSGRNYVGGLIGEITGYSVVVNYSGARGNVTGVNYVGGLIGSNQANVYYSYASGNVIGGYVGGLIGIDNGGSLDTTYATGEVTTTTYNGYAGGLVGSFVASTSGAKTTIAKSYAAAKINHYGGFIGVITNSNYLISTSYWDLSHSGKTRAVEGCYKCDGTNNISIGGTFTIFGTITGLTTSQMKQEVNYAGWSFSGGATTYKDMDALPDYYPCLAWQTNNTCPPAPTGTPGVYANSNTGKSCTQICSDLGLGCNNIYQDFDPIARTVSNQDRYVKYSGTTCYPLTSGSCTTVMSVASNPLACEAGGLWANGTYCLCM